jgi:hypothetical protein
MGTHGLSPMPRSNRIHGPHYGAPPNRKRWYPSISRSPIKLDDLCQERPVSTVLAIIILSILIIFVVVIVSVLVVFFIPAILLVVFLLIFLSSL